MNFGRRPLSQCEGAILAHGLQTKDARYQKGHRLESDDLKRIGADGIDELVVAVLEPGDVPEDEAAARIAGAMMGPNLSLKKPHKGRVNLESTIHGLLLVDDEHLFEINCLDEGLTVASLANMTQTAANGLVASVKIIPLAIPEDIVTRAEAILAPGSPLSAVSFRRLRCGLIQTALDHQKQSAREKTRRLIGWRLEGLGNTINNSADAVAHETGALSAAIGEMISDGAELLLIHGASACVDRRDVVPAAIVEAGGEIERFGMPVDPGNLLVLGRIGKVPVVGLPGCAGSPKLNGLDWVLERLIAGIDISDKDFAEMGRGGLLKETPDRPQPRRRRPAPSAAAKESRGAILLAAGSSGRMGARNKLTCDVGGMPMVRKSLQCLKDAGIEKIVVVLGHEAEMVRQALPGEGLQFIENKDFESGLAGSLRCGVKALEDVSVAAVMLADMPEVQAATLTSLFAVINPADGILAAVPTWHGKRGNPVVWHRSLFEPMMELTGDLGARALLDTYSPFVSEVPVEDPGVCLDIDTEEALKALERD